MGNQEYRVQRGRILKILYRAYDKSLGVGVISITLDGMSLSAPSAVLKAHLTYLEDRGLIRTDEIEDRYFGKELNVRLTYQGIHFVEADKSDEGVELGV